MPTFINAITVKCYVKYLVTNYCALQNLRAGKVIIIHPCVYTLYWYLQAYNVTLAIASWKTLVWSSAKWLST